MVEFLLVFAVVLLGVMLCVGFISIPIFIANARGLCGAERSAIVVLSCLGIFFGITWFVALILACVWRGDCPLGGTNLDKLEKLARLYKDKVITKSEYEKMKAKLLRE